MALKVIITGSTGMVGKGVLLACLESTHVKEVLLINRQPIQLQHHKIKEIIHTNFFDLSTIQHHFKEYDACYFCMGVSSLGLSEKEYHHLTFDIVKTFADVMYLYNPRSTFIYVSGQGTDTSENGKVMWARVKGKTENYILNKGFEKSFAYRPGIILPENGIQSKTQWYNWFYIITKPIFPILKKISSITTTTKVGKSMIATTLYPYPKNILDNKDINQSADLLKENDNSSGV